MGIGIKVGSINFRKLHQPSHHTSDKRGISFFRKWGNIICFLHPVEEVRIKFYGPQAEYVRAKPLHPTQKEISVGDGWGIFSYNLALCYNFYQQVLWHGDKAEIIFPENARKDIKVIVDNIAVQY